MSTLNKMLLREIVKSKAQFFAVAAVIFCGITVFTATYMAGKNLENSVLSYYEKNSFLDYYAEANSITPQAINEIKEISGVVEANGRISQNVGADMGGNKRITLKMISLPGDNSSYINQITVFEGKNLDVSDKEGCLLSKKFADFHNLGIGEEINTIINKKIVKFRIVGIAGSPEFLYTIKSESSAVPSYEDYGIIYINESTAKSLLGYGEAFNQVHVLFEDGANKDDVIEEIEKTLLPYGFIRGIEREDQISNMMAMDDISMLQDASFIFPILFLSVAAMIIYVLQRRIITRQRTLIGVMKAFGYTNARILIHYLLYSFLISLTGVIPALFSGYYLSVFLNSVFIELYGLEELTVHIYWEIFLIAIVLSTTFCLLAAYNSAKDVLKIEPAQAMRAEPPKSGKKVFLERIKIVWNNLSFSWKMVIRNIFRSKQRSIATIMGFTFTIVLFMVSIFFVDSLNIALDQHFFKHQTHDLKLIFSKPANIYEINELEKIDGVLKAEVLLQIPIEIKNGWRKDETVLYGIQKDTSQLTLFDANDNQVYVDEKGVFVAEDIALKLGFSENDSVIIRPQIGEGEEKNIKVKGLIKQYTGFSSFCEIGYLGDILNEGSFANAALLRIDRNKLDEIRKELLEYSNIETVEDKLIDFNTFVNELLSVLFAFAAFMILFGSIMGFAIIFNITVINISDRARELASLKVLGYSNLEINSIIIRENIIIGIISIIPGIILGNISCEIFAKLFRNDVFYIEAFIIPRTYIVASVSIFVFVILAQLANIKKIVNLDLIEVLKNREG